MTVKQRIYRKICVCFGKYISDKTYLKLLYETRIGKKLNLKNPITFDEKLQWLKLYDRKDEYTVWADKYEVRNYVAEKLGEQYLIPLLGVWNSADELKLDDLPEQFVLKCTHDSASVCICTNKKNFDWNAAMDKLQKSLNQNYYWHSREWPYKNITPRIIAEAYMTDESGTELKDYKIYTFGGEPYLIQVDFDRFHNHRRNLYTTEWAQEELLSGLDELTALTDSLADISVPKRYADAGIDELAAQAAEHMQEADSLYHEACSAETFDQERASAAQEHYQRAMKRIHYIGIMLQGRTPDDEEITIIHETTDWTGGDLPDTSDGTVE